MNKIRLFIAAVIAAISFAPLALPAMVHAQNTTSIECGAGQDVAAGIDGTACTGAASADQKVNDTIKLVIRIFQVIVGIVSVIMIILGGLKYVTSGGEASGISAAKNTIIYALLGLVVVALAEIIVQFVINRVNTIGG